MEETSGTPNSPNSEPDPSLEDPVFKIPGLIISDLKSSLSSYFAPNAKTRIARGEKFTVKARRLILNGDIAYLIDWESPQDSSASWSWPQVTQHRQERYKMTGGSELDELPSSLPRYRHYGFSLSSRNIYRKLVQIRILYKLEDLFRKTLPTYNSFSRQKMY